MKLAKAASGVVSIVAVNSREKSRRQSNAYGPPLLAARIQPPRHVSREQTAEPEVVFEWRAEAERRMREAGRGGMSEEQVRDFCSRYMPAYRAYLPGLYDACSRKGAARDGGREQHLSGVGGDERSHANADLDRAVLGGRVEDGERSLVIEVGRDRNPVL